MMTSASGRDSIKRIFSSSKISTVIFIHLTTWTSYRDTLQLRMKDTGEKILIRTICSSVTMACRYTLPRLITNSRRSSGYIMRTWLKIKLICCRFRPHSLLFSSQKRRSRWRHGKRPDWAKISVSQMLVITEKPP